MRRNSLPNMCIDLPALIATRDGPAAGVAQAGNSLGGAAVAITEPPSEGMATSDLNDAVWIATRLNSSSFFGPPSSSQKARAGSQRGQPVDQLIGGFRIHTIVCQSERSDDTRMRAFRSALALEHHMVELVASNSERTCSMPLCTGTAHASCATLRGLYLCGAIRSRYWRQHRRITLPPNPFGEESSFL